ncbi:MAG TPA: TetR/AcrR family transcriptional regulator [Anaerolineae bacterium]|nr:TetR/AcrR family transcriptional regulator [Anaerolineae bacterium]
MNVSQWAQIHTHIFELEQEGLVTRTFRRLDPDRQQRVLAAILEEAVERGPDSLSVTRVAERAGVSVGSLYQYFNSRDGLVNFAVELSGRYLIDEFNRYRPLLVSMPLREGLSAYLTGGIEWSQMQMGLVQFFLRAAYGGDPEVGERLVRPIGATLREIVYEMLVEAQRRGEIRQDLDLDTAARIINTLMIAVGDSLLLPYLDTYYQLTNGEMPLDQLLDTLLDLILRGIGPTSNRLAS